MSSSRAIAYREFCTFYEELRAAHPDDAPPAASARGAFVLLTAWLRTQPVLSQAIIDETVTRHDFREVIRLDESGVAPAAGLDVLDDEQFTKACKILRMMLVF